MDITMAQRNRSTKVTLCTEPLYKNSFKKFGKLTDFQSDVVQTNFIVTQTFDKLAVVWCRFSSYLETVEHLNKEILG